MTSTYRARAEPCIFNVLYLPSAEPKPTARRRKTAASCPNRSIIGPSPGRAQQSLPRRKGLRPSIREGARQSAGEGWERRVLLFFGLLSPHCLAMAWVGPLRNFACYPARTTGCVAWRVR